MSEKSNTENKNKSSNNNSPKSHSSNSRASNCNSSKSSYSSKGSSSSSNSIKNSEDKNLVNDFISSLLDEGGEKEEISNPKEKKEANLVVSVSVNKQLNKKGSKQLQMKPNKKIINAKLKTEVKKPLKKKNKNRNENKIFFSNKKSDSKYSYKAHETEIKNLGISNSRNLKNDLEINIRNSNNNKRVKTTENHIKIKPKIKMGKIRSKNMTPITSLSKNEKISFSSQKNKVISKIQNLKLANHINRTLNFQNTEISIQYKAKLESDKEKKEYEEKIQLMKNHISAMKRQQEDMNKKINFLKNKEATISFIKKEKENEKKLILDYNINKKNELEEKKKNIEKQREILNKQIKESSEKVKQEKINKYKQSQKERQEANNKINYVNRNKSNAIKDKIEQIKALREKNKNSALDRQKKLKQNFNDLYENKYKKNVEKTEKLKLEIQQLKDVEDKLMNRIIKTRERLNSFSSTENIYFGNRKSRKESSNL